ATQSVPSFDFATDVYEPGMPSPSGGLHSLLQSAPHAGPLSADEPHAQPCDDAATQQTVPIAMVACCTDFEPAPRRRSAMIATPIAPRSAAASPPVDLLPGASQPQPEPAPASEESARPRMSPCWTVP